MAVGVADLLLLPLAVLPPLPPAPMPAPELEPAAVDATEPVPAAIPAAVAEVVAAADGVVVMLTTLLFFDMRMADGGKPMGLRNPWEGCRCRRV